MSTAVPRFCYLLLLLAGVANSQSPITEPNPQATDTSGNRQSHHDDSDVVNWYYAFIALFVILLGIGIFYNARIRKKRKAFQQRRRQTALAQDLNGWSSSRRWMHGTYWRSGLDGGLRRQEGLDERGEAPPPYQTNGTEQRWDAPHPQDAFAGTGGLALPQRTLSRDSELNNPPEYKIPEHNTLTLNASTQLNSMSATEETNTVASGSGTRPDGIRSNQAHH